MTALPRCTTPTLVRGLRWIALTVWAVVFAEYVYEHGIPYFRSDLLMWLALGLAAWSIGRRNVLTVVVDFLPLALVLIAYDYLRGLSDTMGMPTWWHPQVDVDRVLFFGHEPTVWLQEHILYPDVQWWEGLVALCYVSFFFLPYVTAAALWLRSRRDFYGWSLRFVALSFIGFACFALMPAAPPWAAARCTAAQVADHPYNPPCMASDAASVPSGGLLGAMHQTHAGAPASVERIVGRGFAELHLSFAGDLITFGQRGVDLVAAVPSLHAGGIMLFSIFMWRRVNRWWRPVLVAYPILMAFTLVFTAEHFFADILAGWLAAVLVSVVAARIERRLSARRRPDTLDSPTVTPGEDSPWPPTSPLTALPPALPRSGLPPETTRSSTSASAAGSSSPRARSMAAPAPPGTTGPSASN
jgi:PAP2 superfamily